MSRNRLLSAGKSIVSYATGGIGALLVLCGLVLFVVPEPVTSVLGFVLVLLGVVGWLVGRSV